MYERIYKQLLLLYPKRYKDRFANEMLQVFNDLRSDELEEKGKIGVGFWTLQFADLTKSLLSENFDAMQKQGIKKYFHLTTYNIWGIILLLPIFIMSVIDFSSRIAQGNLFHYNKTTYNFLSHTFLYQTPVLFTWVILFPLAAVVLNVFPLIKTRSKRAHVLSFSFVKSNLVTLIILCFGLGFIFMIRFHDFLPCVINNIFSKGLNQLGPILGYCRNA